MHPERREQSGQVAAGWLSVIRKAIHQKAITAEREPGSPGDAAAAHLTRATAHRRRRQGARCFCLPVTPVGFLEPGAVQAALLPSGPATVIRTGVAPPRGWSCHRVHSLGGPARVVREVRDEAGR